MAQMDASGTVSCDRAGQFMCDVLVWNYRLVLSSLFWVASLTWPQVLRILVVHTKTYRCSASVLQTNRKPAAAEGKTMVAVRWSEVGCSFGASKRAV